jgi:hypothetical protein
MVSKKFSAIVAVLGICMVTSFEVDAATHLSNEPGYLNMTADKDIFTNSFTTASSFLDDLTANSFIRIKSVNSFTSDDLFTVPRSLLGTGTAYKDSISETYGGKLLASLGLMALIAYRRSYM